MEYRLKPGEIACFNNRRVLHGRTAFNSHNGLRHLQVEINSLNIKYT